MDAANISIKRLTFSLAVALLIPAAASAQAPSFLPTSTAINLVGPAGTTETVSSSNSTQINFNATASYTSGDPTWLCLTQGGTSSPTALNNLTTTVSFTVAVGCTGTNLGIFQGTHTASITLAATSTDTSGAQPLTINVTYTVGSGGGGGTGSVTASPSSITETISYGSQITVYLTLQTSSTQQISFSLPTTPSWINVFQSNGNPGFVSLAQPATLQLTLSGAGLNVATYSTTLTINNGTGTLSVPVTLNNGVAGSGGGTGSLAVYPSTIPWSYNTTNSGTFPASTTVTLTSTNGDIGYSATATSSNGWLLVNSGYNTSGTIGITPLVIGPTTNLGALSPGTYTGTVNITASDGSTAVVTVTVTVTGAGSGIVTINPSPVSLTAAVNGSTTSTTVTINSAVSGTLSASITGSGLSVSIPNTNVTAGVATTLTIFGNPTGLSNGTISGTLNVSVAGNSVGAQVNFIVGTGGTGTGGTTTLAAPSQLYFYYEPGSQMQISQDQQIFLSGSGSYTITSSTTNSSVNWLSVLTTAGTVPATVYVVANATGLASSTYNGTLTITNTSTNTTSQVNVTLLVQGVTTLYASPGDWVFNYIANTSSVSQVQAITVATSDNSQAALNASVTNPSVTPWLNVSGGGTASAIALTVTTNAANLANGTYTGSITVTGGYNTLTIPIVLVVTGSSVSSGSGTLTLGSSALTLQAAVNGSVASTTLSVSASTNTTYSVTTVGSWLSVSPSGTLTTGSYPTLTVIANPAGLAAGTYSGSISLTANGATQTVQVTFVVGGSTGSGSTVTVTANSGSSTSPSLTFTAASVGASVPSQYISVTSGSGQSSAVFTVSATTNSGGSWLTLNTTAGTQYTTPISAITVSVNDTGLAAGTYTGQVTVTPVGGSAVTVPVTLTVGPSTTIGASTTPLTFSYSVGAAAPATQTIAVTVTNATSGSFTATATSTPSGWLVVTPTSGTAPSNVTVSIVPTGLTAGTYTGSIVVAAGSGASGSATIPVTLTVTVALPTITAVVNGASFINAPISPGEIITIGGTNIGPTTPASLTLSGNFVTTTLGGVQVLINGYLAPLLYVSPTQINAIVPYEIAGIQSPTIIVKTNVTSSTGGSASNGFSVTMAATAPGIFTANGSGTGPGSILNANSSVNSASNPAARGSVIQVFMTGEGRTNPAGVDGEVTPSGGPYPAPVLPITITVGGVPANYQFAGEAPGLVSGVLQLNVTLPPASSLTTTGAVPLVVSIGSASSQTGVTVNVN